MTCSIKLLKHSSLDFVFLLTTWLFFGGGRWLNLWCNSEIVLSPKLIQWRLLRSSSEVRLHEFTTITYLFQKDVFHNIIIVVIYQKWSQHEDRKRHAHRKTPLTLWFILTFYGLAKLAAKQLYTDIRMEDRKDVKKK